MKWNSPLPGRMCDNDTDFYLFKSTTCLQNLAQLPLDTIEKAINLGNGAYDFSDFNDALNVVADVISDPNAANDKARWQQPLRNAAVVINNVTQLVRDVLHNPAYKLDIVMGKDQVRDVRRMMGDLEFLETHLDDMDKAFDGKEPIRRLFAAAEKVAPEKERAFLKALHTLYNEINNIGNHSWFLHSIITGFLTAFEAMTGASQRKSVEAKLMSVREAIQTFIEKDISNKPVGIPRLKRAIQIAYEGDGTDPVTIKEAIKKTRATAPEPEPVQEFPDMKEGIVHALRSGPPKFNREHLDFLDETFTAILSYPERDANITPAL